MVIESRAGGKNPHKYSEPLGSWRDSDNPPSYAKSGASGLSPQGRVGSRKLVTGGSSGGSSAAPLASARFTPDFANPGRYRISATWPKGANADPVRYFVRHAEGTDTVAVAQDGYGVKDGINADQWHDLGEYNFGAGLNQYVELQVFADTQAIHTKNACQVFADAIRFTPARPVAGGTTSTGDAAGNRPLNWRPSVAAASEEALRLNRHILVYFYSPTSERSSTYETEVLGNAAVRAVIESKFIPVRVDLQKEPDLASRMRAFKACTINLYDSRGAGVGQLQEPVSASELLQQLNKL